MNNTEKFKELFSAMQTATDKSSETYQQEKRQKKQRIVRNEFALEEKYRTLREIQALCPACHGVKHFHNSTRIGYGEQAKNHF